MSFKILLLAPDVDPSWPEKIRRAVPGVVVKAFVDPKEAVADIVDADAAYGTVPPELLARAAKLRWICADRAGLGGAWFYDELVKGDVIVQHARQLQRASWRPRRRIPARLRPPLRPLPAAKAMAAGSRNDRSPAKDSTDRRGWRRRRRSIRAMRRTRHARARH